MPVATLRWNLPDEQDEFETAQNGYKFRLILSDLDEYLRNEVKHSDRTGLEKKTYSNIREYLRQLSIEYGVDL